MEIPKVVVQMQMFNQVINYAISIFQVQLVKSDCSSSSGRVQKIFT